MRVSFADAATMTLAVCAVIIAGLAVHRELSSPNPNAPRRVAEWGELQQGGRRVGNPTTLPRVVEFADFECPYCAESAEVIDSFARVHKDFALAYYYYPLTAIHRGALKAAESAECAGRQGHFQAAYEQLYHVSQQLPTQDWTVIAVRAGVPDTAAYAKCVAGDETRSVIETHVQLGRRLNFAGTPAFIIDGTLYARGITRLDLTRELAALYR